LEAQQIVGLFLPGGGQNEGESPADAALRETREECGLMISVSNEFGVADELVFGTDEGVYYRKRCVFFNCEVINHVDSTEPNHELVWLSPSEALNTLRHESQQWLLAKHVGSSERGSNG
jgi:8-oxo-dGTP diphosphatase